MSGGPERCDRTEGQMSKSPNRSTAGFSLIEIALALGVMAFALAALMVLLPLGLQSNRETAEETEAVNWMTTLVTDFQNARLNSPSPIFGFDNFPFDENGNLRPTAQFGNSAFYYLNPDSDPMLSTAASNASRYLVEFAWIRVPQIAEPTSAQPAELRISLYWPVPRVTPSDLTAAGGRLDFYLSLRR